MMTSPIAEGRRATAFTVIELLVVMAVIAVMATISVPAVRAISKGNNRVQAANQVRATISQARELARAQHRQVGVVFFEETAKYALPVRGGMTAMQIFVEDYNQAQYPHDPKNTIFVPYSPARSYLPEGIRVAMLNDDVSRGLMNGDEASASVGRTRAILFDAGGKLVTRHGLARPDLAPVNSPGIYPWAMGDWNFTTKGGNPSVGISSPGLFLYDFNEYLAQNIPTDSSGNAQRDAWIKRNSSVILVNASTGGFIQCEQ